MLFWRKTFISNQFVWSDLARIRKFSQQRTDILGFLEDNLLVMLEVKLKVLSTGICSLSSTSVFLHLPLIWITLHVHLMDIVQSIFWSGVSCWTLLNKPHRAFFFYIYERKEDTLSILSTSGQIDSSFFSFYILFELRLLFCQKYPCLISSLAARSSEWLRWKSHALNCLRKKSILIPS